MATTSETAPLLVNHNHEDKSLSIKKDKLSFWSIQAGLIIFVVLIASVLIRLPFNLFTYHPLFMVPFIILVTEGIVLLQPANTAIEKKKGLKYHALIQSISYLSVIAGFSSIFYNKVISGKHHFESFHGKLGLFVFIYLFIQMLFGLTIAFLPSQIFGSVEKGKSLWKYHRRVGYVLIVLVWVEAQFGVRADYMYNNLYSPHLIWFHWVALFFVFFGLYRRIRFNKWGFYSQ